MPVTISTNVQMPHCDAAILHSPGRCEYCDRHPEWQQYRMMARIAFSDEQATDDISPCPSTWTRLPGTRDQWFGNHVISEQSIPETA